MRRIRFGIALAISVGLAGCSVGSTPSSTKHPATTATQSASSTSPSPQSTSPALVWLNTQAEPWNRIMNADVDAIPIDAGNNPTAYMAEYRAACQKIAADAGNALKIPEAPISSLESAWEQMVIATQIFGTACLLVATDPTSTYLATQTSDEATMNADVATWNSVVTALRGQGAATTTPTTAAPTTVPPPTTTSPPPPEPYFSIAGTESTLSDIAAGFGDSLGWYYNKSNGDWEGNTKDGFCQITITNSEGEASNLADNIVFSCGLPTNPSAVTHADAQEETLFTTTLVGQDVGAPAVQWLSQQVTAAANGNGVNNQKTFTGPLGPIQVSVNIGDSQSTIGLLTGY